MLLKMLCFSSVFVSYKLLKKKLGFRNVAYCKGIDLINVEIFECDIVEIK